VPALLLHWCEVIIVEGKAIMAEFDVLLEPKDCALVLLDQQAGLAFGIGSIDRQARY
jgi:hypothetical protein